jgi:hypothetical protein
MRKIREVLRLKFDVGLLLSLVGHSRSYRHPQMHKAQTGSDHRSSSGLRSGRSSPRATSSGTANEYRPSMLMC